MKTAAITTALSATILEKLSPFTLKELFKTDGFHPLAFSFYQIQTITGEAC
jgi:hypothetical protein